MAQLRRDYERFVQRDTEVVVVGPEKMRDFQQYWSKKELPFIGLPDPELKVLNLYGQEFSLLKLGRMPAQAIVDKKGVVRFAHYGHSMSDIPRNNEMLNLLDQIIIEQFVKS
jgi:peroxiredoxin Q/BCP